MNLQDIQKKEKHEKIRSIMKEVYQALVEKGYNSGYAQFFIMTQDEPYFDGYYTAFGKVIEGIEIVDKITKLETKTETNEETGETTKTTTPVNAPIIESITGQLDAKLIELCVI